MPQSANDLDNKLIARNPIASSFSELHEHSLCSINNVQPSHHCKPLLHARRRKEMGPALLPTGPVQSWQHNSIGAVGNPPM